MALSMNYSRDIDGLALAFMNAGIINYEECVSIKKMIFLQVILARHVIHQIIVFYALFSNWIHEAIWADEDRVVNRPDTPILEGPMENLISKALKAISFAISLVIFVSIIPSSKSKAYDTSCSRDGEGGTL
jgi:hypothetical protein